MGQPVAAGKPGMSLGDAAGWGMPSCQAGTPATPGRALRLFLSSNSRETSSKPLAGHLHSHPGSVPPGTAMESPELPGILLERHSGSGEPSLGSKRCGSVRGPSVLPSRPCSAEGSLLLWASIRPRLPWAARVRHPGHRGQGLAASRVGSDVQATPILGKASPAGSLGWKYPREVAADKSRISEPKASLESKGRVLCLRPRSFLFV